MSRRPDREAGAADRRLQARHHHGDAVVHARDRRGDGAAGPRPEGLLALRSASSAPSPGRRRCAPRSRRGCAIDAIDIYGLSEVIGPGVAQECIETKDGLDRVGGPLLPRGDRPGRPATVLPDGEKGELVFTSLTKEAMPVIRYRTRDLTRLLPPTARSMRRIEKITGRSDDMMIIRGVNVFPTQVEELILQASGAGAALPDRDHAAEAPRRDDRAGRAGAGRGQRRRRTRRARRSRTWSSR